MKIYQGNISNENKRGLQSILQSNFDQRTIEDLRKNIFILKHLWWIVSHQIQRAELRDRINLRWVWDCSIIIEIIGHISGLCMYFPWIVYAEPSSQGSMHTIFEKKKEITNTRTFFSHHHIIVLIARRFNLNQRSSHKMYVTSN